MNISVENMPPTFSQTLPIGCIPTRDSTFYPYENMKIEVRDLEWNRIRPSRRGVRKEVHILIHFDKINDIRDIAFRTIWTTGNQNSLTCNRSFEHLEEKSPELALSLKKMVRRACGSMDFGELMATQNIALFEDDLENSE